MLFAKVKGIQRCVATSHRGGSKMGIFSKLFKGENGEWLRTVGKSIQILYNVEANEPTDEESSSG